MEVAGIAWARGGTATAMPITGSATPTIGRTIILIMATGPDIPMVIILTMVVIMIRTGRRSEMASASRFTDRQSHWVTGGREGRRPKMKAAADRSAAASSG